MPSTPRYRRYLGKYLGPLDENVNLNSLALKLLESRVFTRRGL